MTKKNTQLTALPLEIASFFLLIVFIFAGLQSPVMAETGEANYSKSISTAEFKTVSAKDDTSGLQIQVKVPSDWTKRKDLNDDALIQQGDKGDRAYLVVISEPKSDFDKGTKLKDFADIAIQTYLENAQGQIKKGPTKLSINGQAALQYELSIKVNKILSAIVLYTAIEGKNGFHQVMAWTIKSHWDEKKPLLEAITSSFREE